MNAPDLTTITTAAELEKVLEKQDAAYENFNWSDADDAPDLNSDEELREALERIHETAGHPKASAMWDQAYLKGHHDGCGRIAREYADIAQWVKP